MVRGSIEHFRKSYFLLPNNLNVKHPVVIVGKHLHVPKHAKSCVKLIDTQINSFSSDCNLAIHITGVIYSLLIHLLVEYFQETLRNVWPCK